MSLPAKDARELVARRHPEWVEHWRSWRRLADSLEGGDRYRFADYAAGPESDAGGGASPGPYAAMVAGWGAVGGSAYGGADPATALVPPFEYGSVVDRNLVPHANEFGKDGRDLYLLRLARTPPPTDLARVVECHLAKVFAREVRREGPPELELWWSDVDGCGTGVRRWVEDEVGPLLLALGQLDLVVDHPAPPPGSDPSLITTKRDLLDLGLTGAVASVILPENVLWWELDHRRRYREVLTLERPEGAPVRYLHWHAKGVDAYTPKGERVPERSREYAYGAPPIRRVFDRRKTRCRNVGRSRYEGIANLQRAAYNAESERTLADVMHSHPQLMGPSALLGADAEISIGPGSVLPMAEIKNDKGYTSGYQSFEFLDPPQGAQESIRRHVQDFADRIDREGSIAKPAGMADGNTVSQSGVSKAFDQQDGNATLARVAEVLEGAERAAAELALTVLGGKAQPPDRLAQVRVEYPKSFDLWAAQDVADALQAVQTAAAQAGALPKTEAALLQRLVTVALNGAEDDAIEDCRDEVESFLKDAAARAEEAARRPDAEPRTDPNDPDPTDPNATDPTADPADGEEALT